MCLKFTFESLFMNYVFECLIYFVRAIIAWLGDKPIFLGGGKAEEDGDIKNPINYFIGGD